MQSSPVYDEPFCGRLAQNNRELCDSLILIFMLIARTIHTIVLMCVSVMCESGADPHKAPAVQNAFSFFRTMLDV